MDETRERIAEERPVGIDCPLPEGESVTLDGLYRAGRTRDGEDGAVLVAPPHPLYGGSMENPVVTELAYAAADAGLASLRFDWRGVGASTGAPTGDAAEHARDYAAALAHLAETVSGPLCAAGYSAGAAAAVRAAVRHPRVRRLLLVAPPPTMLDAGSLAALRGRVLVVVGSRDTLAPEAALRGLLGPLPDARLLVIPDVDHFFGSGLAALGRAARDWLGAPSR